MILDMKIFHQISNAILFLSRVSFINTIKANFRLLPFPQAIKLPIIVFRKTTLKIGRKAQLKILCEPHFGILRIGALDYRYLPKGSRNYFAIEGSINIKGSVRFSYNTHVVVGRNAELTLGGENTINRDSRCFVHEKVIIEYGARVGWNTQICDTAFHYVEMQGVVTRKTKPIIIDREAWVSSFCIVGRGAYLPKYSVLSQYSMLTKDFSQVGTNLFIAGIPAKVIKTGVKHLVESIDGELCDKIDEWFENYPEEDTLKLTDLK